MNSPILKFTAPYLHDGHTLYRNKALVTDQYGKILDLIPLDEAGENIQWYSGILCPGFINAHCHLELSHLAGKIPEHTGLVNFILALLKLRPEAGIDTILQAAEKADQYMHENGIVAVGDISNKSETTSIKRKSRLYYHTFVEAIGFAEEQADSAMRQAQETYTMFLQQGEAASIVPHAPYSVSGKLLDLINHFGGEAIMSIHNQESPEENKLFEGKKSDFYRLYDTLKMNYRSFKPDGYTSLRSWLPHFNHDQTILVVHNTFTGEEDLAFAENSYGHLYWCLCPNANLFIENALTPAGSLKKANVKIVVGTDSLASNHQLSILEEIKTLQRYFPQLSTEELLQWCTINGAKALQIESCFGSLEKGKQPGIVQIDPISETEGNPVWLIRESRARRIK